MLLNTVSYILHLLFLRQHHIFVFVNHIRTRNTTHSQIALVTDSFSEYFQKLRSSLKEKQKQAALKSLRELFARAEAFALKSARILHAACAFRSASAVGERRAKRCGVARCLPTRAAPNAPSFSLTFPNAALHDHGHASRNVPHRVPMRRRMIIALLSSYFLAFFGLICVKSFIFFPLFFFQY